VSGELAGKVGIVTGAATGIGKAIAIAMAAVGGGGRVVVNHLYTPDRAQAVVAQITDSGGEAIAIAADVSRRTEYRRCSTRRSRVSAAGTSWSITLGSPS
jgi:NAD(P)-dependent dehydrogenase (short-subunit alcohol dehydrogenase family)